MDRVATAKGHQWLQPQGMGEKLGQLEKEIGARKESNSGKVVVTNRHRHVPAGHTGTGAGNSGCGGPGGCTLKRGGGKHKTFPEDGSFTPGPSKSLQITEESRQLWFERPPRLHG